MGDILPMRAVAASIADTRRREVMAIVGTIQAAEGTCAAIIDQMRLEDAEGPSVAQEAAYQAAEAAASHGRACLPDALGFSEADIAEIRKVL